MCQHAFFLLKVMVPKTQISNRLPLKSLNLISRSVEITPVLGKNTFIYKKVLGKADKKALYLQ